jgi:hypothetical protein
LRISTGASLARVIPVEFSFFDHDGCVFERRDGVAAVPAVAEVVSVDFVEEVQRPVVVAEGLGVDGAALIQ